MDFTTPPRVRPVIESVEAFVSERLIPLEPLFLKGNFAAVEPEVRGLRKDVRDMGLLTPHMAAEHGGAGLSLVEFAFVAQALGHCPLGHYAFNCQAPDAGNMEVLAQFGSEEQQARFLAPLTNGEIRSCFAMTEPGRAGSNPTWMDTTAVVDGDRWVINGRKWFTTAADGASFCVVMAVTDPAAERHRQASMIIVPADTPGFTVEQNISVMGHAGWGHDSHSVVSFVDCRVPLSNLLGDRGAGFTVAQSRLGPGRIHHCMRWLGICERSLALMCQRAAERQVKPGEALGSLQMVQDAIAQSFSEIHGARLMVLHAAWRIEKEGSYQARDEISTIKFHVAGVLQRVLDRAIQVHGALGMTDELPLAWWYRHERAARIYDGPDEVHKASVAKRLIRRHGGGA